MRTWILPFVMGLLMIGAVMAAGGDWRLVMKEKEHEQDGRKLLYRLGSFGEGEKRPLIVFLHGLGERGDDNAAQLKHGVRDIVGWCRGEKKACFVLAPQCSTKDNEWWCSLEGDIREPGEVRKKAEPGRSMALLLDLIDEMVASGSVDAERIYLTGLSMGGYGTFDALSRRPELFAAAVPICGGGDPAQVVRYKDVAMWVFHGAKDGVVPVRTSRAMVAAMKEAGGEAKYHEYPDADHDSWTATYRNAEVLDWMFEQTKSGE